MKINKVNYFEGCVEVWTDEFINLGFIFKIDEIVDKDDLIEKVKQRVIEEKDKNIMIKQKEDKFNILKTLEGVKI